MSNLRGGLGLMLTPMTTTDNAADQAADHRRKALEYLGAAQAAQRIIDNAYAEHPDQATRPPSVSRLVGGLNQSVRLGLKAAQVHATLATMPLPEPDPGYLVELPDNLSGIAPAGYANPVDLLGPGLGQG